MSSWSSHMFRSLVPCSMLVLAVLAAGVPAQDKKPQKIENGKLTIKGEVTDDDPALQVEVAPNINIPIKAKAYTVSMKKGKAYLINLDYVQAGWDPFLVIQDKTGKQLAFDDDSGGALKSKLLFSPKADADYIVYAGALNGTGQFEMRFQETAAPKMIDTTKVYEVAKGLNLAGTLTADNRSLTLQVKMEAGASYTIDLMSKRFDCYLYLQDGNGGQIAEDDDGGEGLNSRIVHQAANAGTYRIVITSLGMQGTGDFTFSVRKND